MNSLIKGALGAVVGVGLVVGAGLVIAQSAAGTSPGSGTAASPSGPSIKLTANGNREAIVIPTTTDGHATVTIAWEATGVSKCQLEGKVVPAKDTRMFEVRASRTFEMSCRTNDGRTRLNDFVRVRFVPTVAIGDAVVPTTMGAGLDKCPILRDVRPGSQLWEKVESALGLYAERLGGDTEVSAWRGEFRLTRISAESLVYKTRDGDNICYGPDGTRISEN